MKKIILASASPRRSDLMRQIGLEFTVMPSNVDERFDGSAPEEFAQKLSRSKAALVVSKVNDEALVIGADTIVVGEGILGKPSCDEEAFKMLKSLQGKWHEVITGITVTDVSSSDTITTYQKTFVKMRELTDSQILAYVNTGEPGDKAGAYGIQGLGAILIEEIKGCYYNVVGLPIMQLCKILERFNVSCLGN
jgi:septum formation protein